MVNEPASPNGWRQAANQAEAMAWEMAQQPSVQCAIDAAKLLDAAHAMRAHADWLEAQAS